MLSKSRTLMFRYTHHSGSRQRLGTSDFDQPTFLWSATICTIRSKMEASSSALSLRR